ncbi:MAG TPA: LLM class flavin-dependent oxidoreductase [Gaiellaceae bacterium]|nr:LLM class flavin-dependent oxidoreductase [Gaiellaceae bacterium]
MDFGLVTFADLHPGVSAEDRMRNLLEEAKLADELGLKVFAVGEHHRRDYLVSSPATALAAIAAVTKEIRLSSAVTVLSSDDPVRVFEQFAHVDLISGGRAEIMAGRGSFIESFPLFGFDLSDYDELFTEKLELLLAIRNNERVTWNGAHRAPLENAVVWPRPVQDPLPIWIAVGGSPESVVRAARLGLPLALAIIGGQTARFQLFVDLYRQTWAETGQEGEPRIAINTHAFVAPSRGEADAAFAAPYLDVMNRIGRERGWPPSGRADYEAIASASGPLALGSPEEVAAKIVSFHELFRPERYLGHISIGAVSHLDVMRAIELFGTEVVPLVEREITAESAGSRAAPVT